MKQRFSNMSCPPRTAYECSKNFIHNSQILETTELSIRRRNDKQIEVYLRVKHYSVINKEPLIQATAKNVKNVEWKKLD